jgi:stage V sporulation protein R
MRAFRMVNLTDKANDPALLVSEIHDDSGYRRIRSHLADQYDPSRASPLIEVTDVDLFGDRTLLLTYVARNKARLQDASARQTLTQLQVLWGYPVTLQEVDPETDRVMGELRAGV